MDTVTKCAICTEPGETLLQIYTGDVRPEPATVCGPCLSVVAVGNPEIAGNLILALREARRQGMQESALVRDVSKHIEAKGGFLGLLQVTWQDESEQSYEGHFALIYIPNPQMPATGGWWFRSRYPVYPALGAAIMGLSGEPLVWTAETLPPVAFAGKMAGGGVEPEQNEKLGAAFMAQYELGFGPETPFELIKKWGAPTGYRLLCDVLL